MGQMWNAATALDIPVWRRTGFWHVVRPIRVINSPHLDGMDTIPGSQKMGPAPQSHSKAVRTESRICAGPTTCSMMGVETAALSSSPA